MTQPAKAIDMRERMPETAQWIATKRLEWGRDHVNDCVRRAMVDRAPGYFYAMEAGHVVGTPFPDTSPVVELQRYAVFHGSTFAVFMRQPEAVQTSAQEGNRAD